MHATTHKPCQRQALVRADDKKLKGLICQKGNDITMETSKDNVACIAKHWPHRMGKNFNTLLRGRLEKFEILGAVTGRRAGELSFMNCFPCIDSSSHTRFTAAAATAATEEEWDDDDHSHTEFNHSDISLGSDDTNIDEEEVDNIKADLSCNFPGNSPWITGLLPF